METPNPHEELGLRVLRTFHAPDSKEVEKAKEKEKEKPGPTPGLYTVYSCLLKYKFIEYRILARVLGLSDDRGTITGRDSKGDTKVKKLLEELVSLMMVGKQERKDPREKSKTTGERKDVQEYYYYYVDFGLQLRVVKYRLHMMRKAVEEKLRLGREASAEATADEIGRDGTPYAWECPHCELTAKDEFGNELKPYRYTDLDIAGHMEGTCPAAGCTAVLQAIDRTAKMKDELSLKQEMTQQLRVLEILSEEARKGPQAPTVDMLVERAKTINEAHRRERKHLYDDVLEYSMVPGSIATQQEIVSQDFGGALKLSVSLLCAQCGDPTHGWDNKCPAPRSAPTVCCRPFPQNLAIQAGPLHVKRRRLVGQPEEPQSRPGEHAGAPSGEPQSRPAEAAWRVLLKLWRACDNAECAGVAEPESTAQRKLGGVAAPSSSRGDANGGAGGDDQSLLKSEDEHPQQATVVAGTHQGSGNDWMPTAGRPALLDEAQHCTVVAVSLADGSARVQWTSPNRDQSGAWVDIKRLSYTTHEHQ